MSHLETKSKFIIHRWEFLIVPVLILSSSVGCEDPYAGDPKPEEPKKEKTAATTPYGKAMEAATNLRDEKVPEYNKRLEDLADPFQK